MESHNNKNTKYNFDREYITIFFEDVGGVGRNVLNEDSTTIAKSFKYSFKHIKSPGKLQLCKIS